MTYDWVGVPFSIVGHHDGGFIRAPGLFGFCRNDGGDQRTLLFLDHADCISEAAVVGHPCWADSLSLGMNELHVCLKAKSRIDRLQLRSRIILRVGPLLNALQSAELSGTSTPIEGETRRRAGSGQCG